MGYPICVDRVCHTGLQDSTQFQHRGDWNCIRYILVSIHHSLLCMFLLIQVIVISSIGSMLGIASDRYQEVLYQYVQISLSVNNTYLK